MLLEALFACSLSIAAPQFSSVDPVAPSALCGDEDAEGKPKPEEPSSLCGDEEEGKPKPEEPSSLCGDEDESKPKPEEPSLR